MNFHLLPVLFTTTVYKFKLNVTDFIKFIKNEIIPTLRIKEKTNISYSIACEWLYILGWQYKDYLKNIYFDSHKCEDVITDRNQFLQ